MYITRILYPVQVLGPGNRIGIWMNGCVHHCPGCSNPELWDVDERYHTDIHTVMELISVICEQHTVDGFTITGGDPFFQPDALRVLLPRLMEISKDILVYTGYLYEDLPPDIIKDIAVVIDGRYIQELNQGDLLRGSTNQRIIIADEFKEKYETYLAKTESRIQNFPTREGVVSVGIHLPGYEAALKKVASHKGLEEIMDD